MTEDLQTRSGGKPLLCDRDASDADERVPLFVNAIVV